MKFLDDEPVGGYYEAMEFYKNGLMEVPDSADLLYNFACLNERVGNYTNAFRFFEFALEVKPKWAEAIYGQALSCFKKKEYK